MAQRVNCGKLKDVLEINDLVAIQLDSYRRFLQNNVSADQRKNCGLHEVFQEIFPIENFDKTLIISYHGYSLGEPRMNPVKCIKEGCSYSVPLMVDFSVSYKGETQKDSVYMADMPLMTEQGTFVVNGAERVIISQLHRSPGICFEKNRHASSGQNLYSYRIIPDRGSWLEVQFDPHDNIFIFLDRRRRRRKFLITTFLRAIGCETDREMLNSIYGVETHTTASLLKQSDLSKFYTVEPVLDAQGLEVVKGLEPLNELIVKSLQTAGVKKVDLVHLPNDEVYFISCLQKDTNKTSEDALKDIYRRMRPNDPMNLNNAKTLIKRLFFDVKRYDLGVVGRYKFNEKLGIENDTMERILSAEDFLLATRQLIKLRNTAGAADDIDHLGSRRVRTVGELVQNQARMGLLRTERTIKDRIALLSNDVSTLTPSRLINPKQFTTVIRDFFARNQLSQFMDQTNPLSEMTNKRRLSALGPGGLSRDRAGFEVRDVHASHYGRICPIETPEGPNIGLISSLSLCARINDLGFLETPYRRVVDGVVTTQIDYLTADKEEIYGIAQANAPLTADNHFENEYVMARKTGESLELPASEIDYMDVSPKQMVSVATGLIPFLEHDDANRALMGSNMQRQAVPLMVNDSPLVGTGLEAKVAVDSRAVCCAIADGIVAEVQSNRIVTTEDGLPLEKTANPEKAQEYDLIKFLRTNAGTCHNQHPIVKKGDKVKKGMVIADGAATQDGELALGKNVLVAFMPWCGYNFEDAIVISERIVKEDVYTSIHIEEFEIIARDTKLGPEEITSDIPNTAEDALRNLDSEGVIRLGAEVKPGDILVGKITPKNEVELAPEERLLRVIFGEKAADVKDSSLIVPSGKGGIVMEILRDYQSEPSRQTMTKTDMRKQVKVYKDQYKTKFNELVDQLTDELSLELDGVKLTHPIFDETSSKVDTILISSNRKVTRSSLEKLANKFDAWRMEACDYKTTIERIIARFIPKFKDIKEVRDNHINALETGNPTDGGILKRVKVYIACKRKLQVGDKMAGRHGNKGIVSKIVPIQDMPFMPDGTPVDIVLNPLGVPSRMNVGQVLETHLGYAAKILGFKYATPVFDGIHEDDIISLVKKANDQVAKETGEDYHVGFKPLADGTYTYDGKTDLYDGRTGDKFDMRVMTGYIYMLKLDHLVANKLHARAVGPYSLVTQQPLGGKAQHGGQRFGEMEVWALEAYGASYTLQEILTVKSDDVTGRARIYESIVKGQNVLEAGRPESFNVLMKEMQSLAMEVRTIKKDDIPENI